MSIQKQIFKPAVYVNNYQLISIFLCRWLRRKTVHILHYMLFFETYQTRILDRAVHVLVCV